MKPYAESDSRLFAAQTMFQKSAHYENVVVTQAILDFCNMELFQGGKCSKKMYAQCVQD